MAGVPQLLESRLSRIGRWAGAAFLVCALHAGGLALALMQWPTEEAPGELAGALTVEMAPLPAPAPVEPTDAALGPEQDLARMAPEAAREEVVEKVEEELPPVEPSPAPEPEVALPEPKPEKKEEPEEKEEEPPEEVPPKEEEVPPQDDFNQEEKAPAPVEAPPKPSSVEKPGQSARAARVQRTWQKAVMRHLQRFKRYPRAARRRGLEGTVTVSFMIDRSGRVISAEIGEGADAPSILEKAALDMLRRASPWPVPPAEVTDDMLEGKIPIEFNITR